MKLTQIKNSTSMMTLRLFDLHSHSFDFVIDSRNKNLRQRVIDCAIFFMINLPMERMLMVRFSAISLNLGKSLKSAP